ncbi:hypothetical protein RLEG12_20345 [Rhizobium leguminosarum bv. trifolii CB782]|nr:hypothetical protein RLEG12_20345 [Rhizobium leguminosarum bv. trifolii CB782]EJC72613.1 hypothetical protein Rleg10DRAFT_1036 [Rhizobium leguminosarum bv. trifolii WSM2012]
MIVQACINGARANDFHPRIRLTINRCAMPAASVAAGAAELHTHPREADGKESLATVAIFPGQSR